MSLYILRVCLSLVTLPLKKILLRSNAQAPYQLIMHTLTLAQSYKGVSVLMQQFNKIILKITLYALVHGFRGTMIPFTSAYHYFLTKGSTRHTQ